jgi:rhodanese-related sulfurtransferase
VVYRGDYIKFDITDVTGDAELKIPSLSINQSLNPDLQNAQYFKMKEIGLYPFTLGSITGQIEVVEYDKPQYRTLTANEAANLIRDQSPLILDVRTPQEYSSGRIENSFLIPVQELQTRYAELSEYKNDDIFVYCATGNRSTVAAKILIDNGFTRIHNLRYGIYEWAKNGLPVIR